MNKTLKTVPKLISGAIYMLLLPWQLPAQKQGVDRIDSLLAILPVMHQDFDKVTILADLSATYRSIDPDKGLERGNEAYTLATKFNFKKGEAAALTALAANYWVKHDYLAEEKCLLQALSINEKLGNKQEVEHTIHSIGDVYETQYNYPKALIYYKKALAIAEEIKNELDIMKCQAYIGNIYDLQKNYPEAIAYLEKSIRLSEKAKNSGLLAGYLRRTGLVLAEQGNFEKALAYEKRGLELYRSINKTTPFKDHVAWSLRDLGTVYFQQGNYQKALVNFREAFNQFVVLPGLFAKDNSGICLAKMGKSYLHLAQGLPRENPQYQSYLTYARDTMALAIEMLKPGDWTSLTDALKDLSTVYQLSGNYRASLDAYKEYCSFKDSLYNTEIEKKVIIHEMEFENNRQKDSITHANMLQVAQLNFMMQQKELQQLRGRQQTIYMVIGFAIICLIAFYFWYRNYHAKVALQNELIKERIEKKLKQTEHERNISHTTLTALIAQMNPHFLFNALNTIQSFIYSNDKKKASSYLGKFSELTRKILDNSSKKAISLEEEIALLQLYLDIEKVRFGDNFTATVTTDPTLDIEEIFFPPMLVQPYVENAIKNGLLHKQGKKELSIGIHHLISTKQIQIIIDDNGIGREKSMEINKQKVGHHSFANMANQKRIDLINQGLGKKINLEIIDKKNENGIATGTRIILTIPIMKANLV